MAGRRAAAQIAAVTSKWDHLRGTWSWLQTPCTWCGHAEHCERDCQDTPPYEVTHVKQITRRHLEHALKRLREAAERTGMEAVVAYVDSHLSTHALRRGIDVGGLGTSGELGAERVDPVISLLGFRQHVEHSLNGHVHHALCNLEHLLGLLAQHGYNQLRK